MTAIDTQLAEARSRATDLTALGKSLARDLAGEQQLLSALGDAFPDKAKAARDRIAAIETQLAGKQRQLDEATALIATLEPHATKPAPAAPAAKSKSK